MLARLFPRHPGKFTWRMLATVLGGQALCIFFGALVARGLVSAEGGDGSGTYLAVGVGLAVLAFVAAGMMRRPGGVYLGWLIQLATLAGGFVVPFLFVLGIVFLVLWVVCLVQGERIDREQAARAAEAQTASES